MQRSHMRANRKCCSTHRYCWKRDAVDEIVRTVVAFRYPNVLDVPSLAPATQGNFLHVTAADQISYQH